MPEADLILLFIRPLSRAGIRYVIGGSVAMTFYGEPRLTHDVDVIVFLSTADILQLGKIFPSGEFYVPPVEVMMAEVARKKTGHFNIIHAATSFKADLYPSGNDELNAWAFRQKRSIVYEGENLTVAPPEYVIVRKLEYYREGGSEKHLRDIRSMLAVSGDRLDWGVLMDWIGRQGLQAEWQKIAS